ncbi:ABC exporter membrane fusion protein, DevB family [Rivularia sp. PCC 7116]|uniref:HlyD family efflux transporter periplasmic adaptor subunit n=1 Tax=Rivularia sp. PCC 7116 TaxID=373994 RepID=UPI00029EEDDB|nr:HlyD family efflux transporter periplasmic adaptor subunit [Rivularia sp. PCC 7116]AFY58814.1 ABC exporter membrane fusion protein, DevB family [Rivularia sp. PCC 7116]
MVSTFFKLPKVKPRRTAIIGASVSLLVGGVLLSQVIGNHVLQTKEAEKEQLLVIPEIKTVTALGRLEPEGDIIKIAGSSSGQGAQGNKIDRLLVKEGEEVKARQVIAILGNSDKLKAAYEKAKETVAIAQANLAKVQAGAKTGEIEAQKAEIARIKAQSLGEERAQRETISRLEAQWEGDKATQRATIRRLEAELNNAQSEFRRYESLYKNGAISQSNFDSRRLKVDTVLQQLNEAKAALQRTQSTGSRQIREAKAVLNRIQNASSEQISSARGTLSKIAEVRPVDVTAAKAELRQAVAADKEAKANFEQSLIKAPTDGVILKINSRSGETASNDGIVELGKVQQMMVLAEVYQAHIGKIKEGQNVRVTSNSLGVDLTGKVDFIGWKIQRQNVINADPSDNIDARVVEVKVRLDEESSKKAAKLTNLQVKAIFEL